MIIALASPGIASTLDEGLHKVKQSLSEASAQGAEIVCFPEAYLPGLRITKTGRQIAAVVIDARGEIQGCQTKNQLDPSEDKFYVPGNTRQMFEVNGNKFGVAICHEGWRYPETVRWAAVRGAKVVFHPQQTGSDREDMRLTQWGFQEAATSVITPSGQCQAHLPYGKEGVLVQAINVEEATGLIATRYAPERYEELKRP